MRFFLIILLNCCFLPTIWAAAPQSGDYAAAADAYRQGDFAGAAKIYLAAIQNGEANASLYYNLGTSLYKNGEIGAALAAHLRARSLDPNDPDIRYNLRFLQEKAKDKLDIQLATESWRKWSAASWLGERSLFWASAVPLTLCLVLLGWHLFAGRAPLLTLTTSGLLLLVSLYLGLSLADSLWRAPDWGAVVSSEVDVLASPTIKNGVAIFQLHEGAPFAVMGESGEWYKIQLSDGKTGWMQREHLAIFGKNFFSYQTAKGDSSATKSTL